MSEKKRASSLFYQLKKMLDKKEETTGKKAVPIYLVLILIFGIILMVIGTIGKGTEEEQIENNQLEERNTNEALEVASKSTEESEVAEAERAVQTRLGEMLEKISGVSDVQVMVNLQGTEVKVYEKDTTIRQQVTTEEDREGGQRELEDGTKEEQIVIVRQGDQEEPLLIHTKKPEARGVLVVAEGVEDMKVKEWVIEAVTKAMDVAPHKVSVLPKNRGEGDE
ncbi:stage III sporulation protein AG [Alteribacillus persepolensis]|uniref:Stage III sporulation protein AG n=1 Tax=Alteribacillus persepolensis TaxID=568899 RepID=A0A1G8CZV4_9BACI|nr:stage III sporulation protein AG [Alteribacillus persepolensis]SDH51046.1 stage III sporulation protein AG [Alteribacillus persepolensis]